MKKIKSLLPLSLFSNEGSEITDGDSKKRATWELYSLSKKLIFNGKLKDVMNNYGKSQEKNIPERGKKCKVARVRIYSVASHRQQ